MILNLINGIDITQDVGFGKGRYFTGQSINHQTNDNDYISSPVEYRICNE
jgi:hypothetical protein